MMKNALHNQATFTSPRHIKQPYTGKRYRHDDTFNFIPGKLQEYTFSPDRTASEERIIPAGTYDKDYYAQEDAYIMNLVKACEAWSAEARAERGERI